MDADEKRVTIFAAASTADVMQQIADQYQAQTGVTLTLSFASSSTLARQIEQGAPADIFLSANALWMDHLDERGLLTPESRVDLLSNDLVLIAPANQAHAYAIDITPSFDFASGFTGPIALGDPSHVPAGMYARQALQQLGWWDALASRVIGAADVRAALNYVAQGEAALGIVYATDARSTDQVTIIATFPASITDPVRYSIARTVHANTASSDVMLYLQGDEARVIFEAAGFTRVQP